MTSEEKVSRKRPNRSEEWITREKIAQFIADNVNNSELWGDVQRIYAYIALGPRPNYLKLPETIHTRLDTAGRMGARYITYNGLFIAPSPVGEDQLGVFCWIDLDENVILTTYGGRIWEQRDLDLYLANHPDFLLRKQRYLFSLSSEPTMLISDPTDLFGNLPDVHLSGNIGPYFNEPPLQIRANCSVEIVRFKRPGEIKTKRIKKEFIPVDRPLYTLYISTCAFVPAFHELFILYENESQIHNGVGTYDLRNYLVGSPCVEYGAQPMPPQTPSNSPPLLLAEVNNKYNQSLEHETKRLDQLAGSEEFKHSSWIRPELMIVRERKQPDRWVWSWERAGVRVEPKEGKRNQFQLVATQPLLPDARFPILGIPLTAEAFHAQEISPFMSQSRAGYLLGNPGYRPWNHVGGDGAFIWVWMTPVRRSMLANMEFHPDGYFYALRSIAPSEILTYYSID